MTDVAATTARNLADVRERIALAAGRSGRAADAVRLVAVTKYVGAAEIRALLDAGCRDLGESRPQRLWTLAAELAETPIAWHLIGHLQRNKAARTVPLLAWLHAADSLRLLTALDEAAAQRSAGPLPTLLEVNISGDPRKHGFEPREIDEALAAAATHGNLEIRGLMAMAGEAGNLDAARRDFAALRELRDRAAANCPAGVRLDELSMGMSGDYEAAIEEGATIVRVGSALFEGQL